MSKQNNKDTSICFPGEESWELWRQKSGIFEVAETAEIEEGGLTKPFKSATHFAFPIVSAFAVPIWASSEDKAVVNGVVEMHLEGLGVKPGNPIGQLVDYRVALRKDGRSLVLATVLSEGYQISLPRQNPNHFDVSARFLVLPSNHITVWKELGRLVLAVTRDDSIVHFQALSAETIDAEAVREIKCLMIQLTTEDVLDTRAGLMLRIEGVDDATVELAQEKLGIRIMRDLRPAPVLPEKGSKLLPSIVAIQRKSAARRRKIVNIIAAVAAVWAAYIGWKVWDYTQEKKIADDLVRERNRKSHEAKWIPGFKKRYDQLRPAIEVQRFPFELYHRLVSKVPQYCRPTRFSVENDAVHFTGEAKDSGVARKFGGVIFDAPDLDDYKWDWEKRPIANKKRNDGTVEFSIYTVKRLDGNDPDDASAQ